MIRKSDVVVLAVMTAATPAYAKLVQPSSASVGEPSSLVKFPDVNRSAKTDRLETMQVRAAMNVNETRRDF